MEENSLENSWMFTVVVVVVGILLWVGIEDLSENGAQRIGKAVSRGDAVIDNVYRISRNHQNRGMWRGEY